MAGLDWFVQNISKPLLDAGTWLGKNVITPGLDFLKQTELGDIVNKAQPFIDTVGKTWNYASGAANEADARQKGTKFVSKAEAPTLDDFLRAKDSFQDAGQAAVAMYKTGGLSGIRKAGLPKGLKALADSGKGLSGAKRALAIANDAVKLAKRTRLQ